MTKPSIFIGDTHAHEVYGEYKVVDYINSKKVLIRFSDTGFEYHVNTANIKSNQVRDKTKQLLFGVGSSYSKKYNIRVNNKKTPQYAAWENMVARCYYKKASRYSAYGGKGVKVAEDWLIYENFAEWYDLNYVEGYHLDKDLLGDGTLYSEANCCYIPQKLNGQFVVNSKNIGRKQSHLPTGIHHQGEGFTSAVNSGSVSAKKYFKSSREAHNDYIKRKWDGVRDMAENMYRWTEITERVYRAVVNICNEKQGIEIKVIE